MDPELIRMAHEAIAAGVDPQKVAAKFRELSGGQDLPSPAVAAGQIQPPQQAAWADRNADSTTPAEERVPSNSHAYMPLFARDRFPSTPDENRAAKNALPLEIAGASLMVPAAGPLANFALGGLTGAAMGAAGAEPGHRIAGAVSGGLLGLGTGAVLGTAGTLARPARIAKAIDKLNEVRAPLGAALYNPLNQEIADEAVLKFLQNPAIKNDVAAVAADVADGIRAPTMSDLQKLRTRWKVGRFRDSQAHEQLTGMMQRIEPALKAKDARYAEFNNALRALTKDLPAAERAATRTKIGLLAAGGLGMLKHSIPGLLAP